MNRTSILLSFALLLVSVTLFAQPGTNDTSFNTSDPGFGRGDGPMNIIRVMVLQPDEKTLIAGDFTTYNSIAANRIARVNANGYFDSTFNIGTGADSWITAMALQSDGKIIIGGDFTSFNGTPINRIARLNSDGTLDATFNIGSGVESYIDRIIIQPNGKIIISGFFGTFNGVNTGSMVRLNSDGSLDNSFSVPLLPLSEIKAMVIQPNGKLILGGAAPYLSGPNAIRILRLNSDGSLDNTFNVLLDSTVTAISLQSNGKILVSGHFSNCNGSAADRIIRLNSDGSIDTGFNSGLLFNPEAFILSSAIQADGKILVGGFFATLNAPSAKSVARLNSDGSVDTTFDPLCGIYDQTLLILPKSNGKIIVHGEYHEFNVWDAYSLIQLESSGQRDYNYNLSSGANLSINAFAIQSDDKIVIGGDFNSYNNVLMNRIARLNSDGSLDGTFNIGTGFKGSPSYVPSVSALAIQSDGKILAGGPFTSYNGTVANRLIRLNTDGSIDNTFNFTANNGIRAISIQPDGKIIIGGSFGQCNGVPMNYIARLNSDGSLDNSFNIGSGFDYPVYTVAIQSDGKILVGGGFFSYNGSNANSMARLNTDGTLDNTFTFPIEFQINWNYGMVYEIKIQSDGKYLIGGEFEYSNVFIRKGIARLLPNGNIDNTFDVGTGTNDDVVSIAIQQNGSILIGGRFTTFNEVPANGVVRLNSNGSLDPGFSVSGANYPVLELDTLSDGKILMAGAFTSFNGVGRNRITRIYDCYPTTSSQTISTCGNYTWSANGQTYSSSGIYTAYLVNSVNCDSIVTLDLTIIPDLPLVLENSFSMPSDANSCVGEIAITVSGNADFELDIDNGSQVITSSGYSLVTGLCAGTHDLHVTDNCGDTLSTTIVIPVDSNYVFNNPFIDSLAQDSLGVTLTNCDIYYGGINTAYIDSIWATGNTVNVIWNIVDSNGSNLDTTTYVLNNGNGVYWLQLSVFCPFKSTGEYFTVTEAIYFNNGSVSTAGLPEADKNLFVVYPNPTNDQVHISFSGSEAELTVYDVQGKVVLKDRIQNQGIVSLQSFERGVYLFDLKHSTGHSIQRIIKQ